MRVSIFPISLTTLDIISHVNFCWCGRWKIMTVVLIYISLISKTRAFFPVLFDKCICSVKCLFLSTAHFFLLCLLFYWLTVTTYVFSGCKWLGFYIFPIFYILWYLSFFFIHGVSFCPEVYVVESVRPILYGLMILYLLQDYKNIFPNTL